MSVMVIQVDDALVKKAKDAGLDHKKICASWASWGLQEALNEETKRERTLVESMTEAERRVFFSVKRYRQNTKHPRF